MENITNFMNTWNERDSSESFNTRSKIFNKLDVELSKSGRDDCTVRINYIQSRKRRKGELKKFLTWITKLADANEFTLTMAAQPCGRHYEDTPKKEKLKEIIERYGFTVRFEYPDGNGYEMVRYHFPEKS